MKYLISILVIAPFLKSCVTERKQKYVDCMKVCDVVCSEEINKFDDEMEDLLEYDYY